MVLEQERHMLWDVLCRAELRVGRRQKLGGPRGSRKACPAVRCAEEQGTEKQAGLLQVERVERQKQQQVPRQRQGCPRRKAQHAGVTSGSPSIVAVVEAEKPGRRAWNSVVRFLRSHRRRGTSHTAPKTSVLERTPEAEGVDYWGRGVAQQDGGVNLGSGRLSSGAWKARRERRQVRGPGVGSSRCVCGGSLREGLCVSLSPATLHASHPASPPKLSLHEWPSGESSTPS